MTRATPTKISPSDIQLPKRSMGIRRCFLARLVPPNNQGLLTRFYNQNNDGDKPAREGVGAFGMLDRYTQQTIFTNHRDYQVFAGQRDDGFYADIQSIFDLDFSFSGPNKPFELGGIQRPHHSSQYSGVRARWNKASGGVYATTSRQKYEFFLTIRRKRTRR